MRFLDKHGAAEKRLRHLEREAQVLWKALRNRPVIPLETPFQRGWERHFTLREDIHQRPDRRVFAEVLPLVNWTQRCRNPEFLDRHGKPKTFGPRIIPLARWRALAWPESHQRLFGFGHWQDDQSPRFLRQNILGYRLHRSWWLTIEVLPLMITHRQVDLPEVRERLAEIEAYMSRYQGWHRLGRLHGHRQHWHEPHAREHSVPGFLID
jgi:hypothetical protein